MRSILRHDPDVVLIGEIRDRETAEIAVQASLTGHLVFSTLHTNDAPGATTRLIDMGVEPYLVASSLEMVAGPAAGAADLPAMQGGTAARLKRKSLRAEFGDVVPAGVLSRHAAAGTARARGYRGRQGVFEMMPITDEIRALILERASSREIRKVAIEQGMNSLREDGWRLVGEGTNHRRGSGRA